MVVTPGNDVIVVRWFKVRPVDVNKFALDILNKYQLNLKVFVLDLNDSTVKLNGDLHGIYRTVAACGWQAIPLVVYILIMYTVTDYIKSKKLSHALTCMANTALFRFQTISTDVEFEDVVQTYPLSQANLLGPTAIEGGIGGWGNLVRRTMIDFLAENFNYDSIYVIGLNSYSLSRVIQVGCLPKVIEIENRYLLPPYDFNLQGVTYDSKGESQVYLPPDSIKLEFLHDLVFSRYAKYIYYIGAAPGLSIIKRDYTKKWTNKPKLVMYDPKFASDFKTEKVKLTKKGWDVRPRKFRYSKKDIAELTQLGDGRLVICDDAYIRDDQYQFTQEKLDFYYSLMSKYKGIVYIYLKFNFSISPTTSKQQIKDGGKPNPRLLTVNNFNDIILQPGSNDSNETRLVLTNQTSDTVILNETTYKANLNVWKTIPLRQQLNSALYYFRDVILRGDFFTLYKQCMHPVAAAYVLSNLSNGNVAENTQKIQSAITDLNRRGIPMLFTLPNSYTDLEALSSNGATITYLTTSRDTIQTSYSNSVFRDNIINNTFMFKLGCADILPQQLINFGSDSTSGVIDIPVYSRSHTIFMNATCIDIVTPQDGRTSPGPIIKAWTAQWKVFGRHSNRETYALRLKLIQQITDMDDKINSLKLVGNADVTFQALEDVTITIKHGILRGKHINLLKDQKVVVSGHLLNIVMAACYGYPMIGLWIKAWITQQSITKDNKTYQDLVASRNELQLYDYSSNKNLRDTWHSLQDVLFAVIIIPLYVTEFDLPLRNSGTLDVIANQLWDNLKSL